MTHWPDMKNWNLFTHPFGGTTQDNGTSENSVPTAPLPRNATAKAHP